MSERGRHGHLAWADPPAFTATDLTLAISAVTVGRRRASEVSRLFCEFAFFLGGGGLEASLIGWKQRFCALLISRQYSVFSLFLFLLLFFVCLTSCTGSDYNMFALIFR